MLGVYSRGTRGQGWGWRGAAGGLWERERDLHLAGGWEHSQLKGWTWHWVGPAHCPPWSPWRWLVVLFC